jgi:hypothetical protein
MKPPIDLFLDKNAVWTALPGVDNASDVPYATHSGVWEFQGMSLKVYRLSDGRAVIEEDSMRQFLYWLACGDAETVQMFDDLLRKPTPPDDASR